MKSHASFQSRVSRIAITLCTLFLMANTALAQKNLLVKVKKDGRETSLYQKLITIKAVNFVNESPAGGAKVQRVGPYNIFFHLKTDDGQLERNGYYRIGNSQGTHQGWIPKAEVVVWASRFVIWPKQINEEITYTVEIDKKAGGGQAKFDLFSGKIPDDAAVYSFILGDPVGSEEEAADIGPFPVAFCIVRTDQQGSISELNQLGDMKLEIVFVIEDADYLTNDYAGNARQLHQYVLDLGTEFVDTARKFGGGKIPVRFGLVAATDTSNNFTKYKEPALLHRLSDDFDTFLSRLRSVTGQGEGRGDYPNDGRSAIYSAVTSPAIGWETNSSKHIVYLGNSPFQDYGVREEGTGPPLKNYLTWVFRRDDKVLWSGEEWHDMFGSNTSGKDPPDLMRAAFTTGVTTGSALRAGKHIHLIHIGQTIEQVAGGADNVETCKKFNALFNDKLKALNPDQQLQILNKADLIQLSFLAWKIEAYDQYDKMAQSEFRAIASHPDNNGYYTHMKPTPTDVTRVTNELAGKVKDAIEIISQVAKGDEKDAFASRATKTNEITRPLFKLVGSAMGNTTILDQPVQIGTASLIDPKTGRSVGEKRIMVSETELNRLKTTFNALYDGFKGRRKTADRLDTKDILDRLKTSLATAAAGQKIDASTKLEQLITDLPLRTEALKFTANDIAVMATKDFDAWLEELELVKNSIINLLQDRSLWIKISSMKGQAKEEYAFLRFSELP